MDASISPEELHSLLAAGPPPLLSDALALDTGDTSPRGLPVTTAAGAAE